MIAKSGGATTSLVVTPVLRSFLLAKPSRVRIMIVGTLRSSNPTQSPGSRARRIAVHAVEGNLHVAIGGRAPGYKCSRQRHSFNSEEGFQMAGIAPPEVGSDS